MLGHGGSPYRTRRARRVVAGVMLGASLLVPGVTVVAQTPPDDQTSTSMPATTVTDPTTTTSSSTTTTTTTTTAPPPPPETAPPTTAAPVTAPPETAPPTTAPPVLQQATAPDGTPLPRGGCTVSSVVRPGSTGPDVMCLERVLAGLNYQFAGPDETYDVAAINSLKDYQRRNRIRADGILGPATGERLLIWPGSAAATAPAPAALPEGYDGTPLPRGGCTVTGDVRAGSNPLDILCVERVLAGLHYQFAGPDGVLDQAAVNSLKDWQRRNRLRADGVVNAATGNSLLIWPGSPAAPAPAAAGPTIAPQLPLPLGGCQISAPVRLGTTGPDALCAEQVLAGIGYQFEGPDDYFEIHAVNSIKAFQAGKGIRPDGVLGAATASLLGIWSGPVPQAEPPPAPQGPGAFGLPANSGHGRRVVYSRSQQRVWAVEADGTVVKTHAVSGRTREPYAGTYRVYSRSMYTYSADNPLIKWRYMVRFAYGPNGGRIGFHEIPTKHGVPLQSEGQLGQPLSGGCVRQSTADAQWMWNWAGVGTTVVVL